MRSYAARYVEARAQIGINRAPLYPTLGTQALAQGLRDSSARPYFNTSTANPAGVSDLQLPLTFNWELDFWGAIRRNINIAKEETQATAADLETAQLSVQAELAMDYFELRTDDAQSRLLGDTVKDYQEALRITTNRFEGGISNESDVFQAKTQLQAAIVQQQDIAVQRAQYEHAIAILIGQPPNSFSLTIAPLAAQRRRPSRPACPRNCLSAARTSLPPSAARPKPTNASASLAPPISPPSASPPPPASSPTRLPASSMRPTSSTPSAQP